MHTPCNISALVLNQNCGRDEKLESCVAITLQDAANSAVFAFLKTIDPAYATMSVGLTLVLCIALKVCWMYVQAMIKEIREQYESELLNASKVNEYNERLEKIKYQGDIPNEFICSITRMIMCDPCFSCVHLLRQVI